MHPTPTLEREDLQSAIIYAAICKHVKRGLSKRPVKERDLMKRLIAESSLEKR